MSGLRNSTKKIKNLAQNPRDAEFLSDAVLCLKNSVNGFLGILLLELKYCFMFNL